MRAIPKTAKIHPAAKKCCGWEEPAICHCRFKITFFFSETQTLEYNGNFLK